MKSICLALSLLIIPSFSFAKPAESYPRINESLLNFDGKELTLEQIKGAKGTLVIFGASHCPFVKSWLGRIAKLGEQAKKQGLGVVMINPNDPESEPDDAFEKMPAFHKMAGFQFPYAQDRTSNIARAFKATRTPEVFLYNSSGKLVYHGAIDDNADSETEVAQHFLKNALDQMGSGQPIKPDKTKFIGCSIKFRAKKG